MRYVILKIRMALEAISPLGGHVAGVTLSAEFMAHLGNASPGT